jgi:Dna[CI] antecedent, DciA
MDRLADDIRAELQRFGAQAGMPELLDRWPAAVGAAIARHAWPARITRDGTVVVHTSDSVWAFELGQRALEIARRLGVETVRFVPGQLPDAAPEPPPALPTPTADEEALARSLAAPIEQEILRETVQKAITSTLARGRFTRSV